MRPPRWSDDEAVAKFIGKIIDDTYDDAEREFFELQQTLPPLRITSSTERSALATAERGDFKALADFLEKGDDLSPRARAMISAKLRGTFKGRRGPPKQTLWQRDLDPKHGAAEEVERIIHVLKRHYPRAKGHTQRAVVIAAARAGIDPEKFATYYSSSRHRRRPT